MNTPTTARGLHAYDQSLSLSLPSPMENSAPLVHPILDLPRFLLDWPSWAAWTAPVKKPLDLRRNLRNADVTHPDTWAAFSHARTYLARAARLAPPALPLSCGVGILVAPPLCFIDFDDLVPEPESPRPTWATEFLQRAADIGAFTEWSGSGTGAHAFIRTSSSFPALTRNRYTRTGVTGPVGIEVYTSNRFAALSGFPYFPHHRPELNDPRAGDALLTAFIADLGVRGAPILSPALGPIAVPPPTEKVLSIARTLAEVPVLARAFAAPQEEFAKWAIEREKRSLDSSASAWRFYLYGIAARESPISPLPIYELFNPKKEPQHAGIPEWQEASGYLRKKHRVYSDIQRAHALIVEEQRLLALDLGEPPPPAPSRTAAPRHPVNTDLADSWAQLGLAMKVTKNSAVPVVGSVNFIRVIEKHSHFQQYKIERNALDGTTRVNRQPIPDTLATRFLEPIRTILDMSSDPPIQGIRDAIEVVADDNPYDPLVEYLRGLPTHDIHGPSFLSTWLHHVGAEPDPDLERYSRRILLGLVARALKPGVKFDYVPVFEGPQGVGKSTLVSLLVTPDYYAVLSDALQSKDAKVVIRGKWAVELAEMAAYKRSDEEARKAFFSAPADDFRPPYGRASIKVLRRTVLFGTTNDKQYLSDHTGARRYWPIHFPHEMDLKWFSEHRDALFAEALHYFEKGEAFHDTIEESQSPERLASLQDRLITPAWQVRVIEHLKNLPAPHLPTEDKPGHPGIITTQYIADLHRILDLPQAVQNMSDAQLAAFIRRAGYHAHVLSYKHEGASKKTYGWAHPRFLRLTSEQSRAFLSFFPGLFSQEAVPLSWIQYRDDHLDAALRHLGNAE
jgi:Virulence-associated protein E